MTRVMVAGTFDLLHVGHLDLFRQAKKLGNHLVVVVASDSRVKKFKGRKPFFSQIERMEIVSAVKYVDEVVLGKKGHIFAILLKIRPDIILLGYDQKVDERELHVFLEKHRLKTKVIRGKAFEAYKFKSSKLKELLGV